MQLFCAVPHVRISCCYSLGILPVHQVVDLVLLATKWTKGPIVWPGKNFKTGQEVIVLHQSGDALKGHRKFACLLRKLGLENQKQLQKNKKITENLGNQNFRKTKIWWEVVRKCGKLQFPVGHHTKISSRKRQAFGPWFRSETDALSVQKQNRAIGLRL